MFAGSSASETAGIGFQFDGGEIHRRGLADFPLIVRSDYIPRIQEIQASVYHVIREALEVLGRGDA